MEMGVEVFKAFGSLLVNEREVKVGSEAAGARSEEIVAWNVELRSHRKRGCTEGINDKGTDGGIVGDGHKGLVDVRVVEAEELESKGFFVGRGERIERERNGGEVVESDGRNGGGDAGEIRSSRASVVRWSDNEYGDGE